ncbi:MAG: BatD family protein [Prevotellaceae bacterium]|jgi:hypothetical protein|nr:BatD family protein [Prevotellaceae bacterium]
MKHVIKQILILILFWGSSVGALADPVTFTAQAPAGVAEGQTFQLTYSVNKSADNLQLPEIKGFEIVAGPFSSSGSSVQYVNGKVNTSVYTTFTYTLLAQKEGVYTIPAATVHVDKKQHTSNAVTIKVLPRDAAETNQQGRQQQATPSSQQLTEDNLFIRPIVSRTQVYEQEVILLTYKLYTRVDVVNITDMKLPDFKKFLLQEIEINDAQRYGVENYKDRNYNTVILKQTLLFPQNVGDISIEPMSCTAVVRLRSQQRGRNFFDSFFDSYQDVKKTLSANRINISVKALPKPKPTNFSGAVGKFSLQSDVNATQVEVNSPITVKLKITGTGNLKLLKDPTLRLPADFESYEPKITNNFSVTTSGMSGTKTVEYLAIPRHSGQFDIPAVDFCYFDLSTNSYKTIASDAFTIVVDKSTSVNEDGVVMNYSGQEQIRQLGNDIRYIRTGDLNITQAKTIFTGSMPFWTGYLVSTLITLLLIFFFQKQAKANADMALVRTRRANKMARKRLRTAGKYLKTGEKELFYNEILRALWGYLCDKLTMPVASLNKENVSTKLAERSVQQPMIDTFIGLLNSCEFERYAPLQNSQAAMDRIFNDTISIISSLENSIKK